MGSRAAVSGWIAKRREARRAKREREGDSPEKRTERHKGSELSSKEAMARVGEVGFLSGQ
jgi:hypothetical protein